MTLTIIQKRILIISLLAILGVAAIFLSSHFRTLLSGSLLNNGPNSITVTGQLKSDQLVPGQYVLHFNGRTSSQAVSTATTFEVGNGTPSSSVQP